jgi:hypothetical protein
MTLLLLLATLLGEIHDSRATVRCGCAFWRKGVVQNEKHKIFFAEGGGRPALMNIDGKDAWLELKTPNVDDDYERRVVVKYANARYRVEVDRRFVRKGCPPEKDDCEYLLMNATITVRTGKRIEKVRVVGSCGC